ncbi:hypothetical protein FACS189431_7540 [Alphaproteobacteria bacterium]|nr:hypothetical protein FACS189431_7540 [Alphaproteobacteria bacterium]
MTETGRFYILGLGLLLSSVLSSCYGPEIDRIDEGLTVVQNDMAELKKKIEQIEATINSMDWVTGVSPISGTPGGWTITFHTHPQIDLKNGTQGAQGANGSNGKDGTIWYIGEDSVWHAKPNDIPEWGNGNPLKAIGEDGRDAPSPEVINGKWAFFTWNKTLAQYDTAYTNFVADTTRSYLVDKNVKYDLYFPLRIPDTSPGAVAGDSILYWTIIELPKYQEEPLAIYFKGFGYISHGPSSAAGSGSQDSIVMLPDGLSFNSWKAIAANPSTPTNLWYGTKQTYEGVITTLHPELVAVFSTNKTRTTTENLYGFELQNSNGVSLDFFNLYNPQYIGNKLLTKVTQSDSLFYLTVEPSSNSNLWTIKGNIYYYLVNGTSKSAVAHTINGTPTIESIPSTGVIGTFGGITGANDTTYTDRGAFNGLRYQVRKNTPYPIIFADRDNIYDFYIDSVGGASYTSKLTISTVDPLSFMYSDPTWTAIGGNPADTIYMNLILHKLLKTGQIYEDTIKITVIP